jgi:hypothetical protein
MGSIDTGTPLFFERPQETPFRALASPPGEGDTSGLPASALEEMKRLGSPSGYAVTMCGRSESWRCGPQPGHVPDTRVCRAGGGADPATFERVVAWTID